MKHTASRLHGDPVRNLHLLARENRRLARRAKCEEEACSHGNRAEWATEAADALENLIGWVKFWRRLPEVSITNFAGPPEHNLGREIPTVYLDAALRGEQPPRRAKP